MNRSPNHLAWVCVVLFFLACSSPPTPVDTNASPKTLTRQGAMSAIAQRFLSPDNPNPIAQFSFMAVFPAYYTKDNPPLDSILDAHVPDVDLPMDQCSVPEPAFVSLTQDTPQKAARISLLDAGDMFLIQGRQRVGIPTRTFPDLMQVVDGVMYTASHRDGLAFWPGKNYAVRAMGTDEVAGFEVLLEAPEDLGDVRVNAISPGDQVPVSAAGQPLELTWEGPGYGDEVIARIRWSSMGLAWHMVCRMRDDGAYTFAPDVTRRMGAGGGSRSDFEMTLSRVRQISFRARGIDFGDFNFVASTGFFFRFEEPQ